MKRIKLCGNRKFLVWIRWKNVIYVRELCEVLDRTRNKTTLLKIDTQFYVYLSLILMMRKAGIKILSGEFTLSIHRCGVGTEYMAVTPSGDLFPCHQFVGYKELALGNIWEGVKKPQMQDEFRKSNLYTKKECEGCWANFYCSGGCPANGYMETGDINGVYEYGCKIFKKRMECAIMIKVVKALGE